MPRNIQTDHSELLERLASHKTLGVAPREELAWLAAHGSHRCYDTGEAMSAKDRVVEGLAVVLTGRIAIFVDQGGVLNKLTEWRGGEVTGLLPYSRMQKPPGDTIAQEPTEVLFILREHLREMIRECHAVTSMLVHIMLDRARTFNAFDLHNEKMISLGKLSAGLAHELNNPVAAIERSAALLERRLDEDERATRALGAARLGEAQLAAIDAVRTACLAAADQGVRSPIEQGEREEAIADWLSAHGLETDIADPLTETAVTMKALDGIAAAVDRPSLDLVLRWAAAGCSVRALASEIQEAAMRISGLVAAIKGFTHMDQASVAEPVNLARGLNDTVTVLRSKARGKSASVVVDVEPDLPPVMGFVGELNQIWSNLIDNALDAIPVSGRVEVHVGREGNRVAVRIVDNGGGIPDGIRERIFDPFFTTKPVGSGTGLGLDIVSRLVRHNGGAIAVESQPGRTEFVVTLPAAGQGTHA